MKRKALLICLLVAMTFSLQARISIEPTIALSAGGTFTTKDVDILRSSYSIRTDLDLLCININEKHFISFPTYLALVSRTPYTGGYCLNSHVDYGIGLGYRYRFNDIFSLKGSLECALRYVPEVNGGLVSMGWSIEPWFHINEYLAVTTPIRLGFTKFEGNVSVTVGLCYLPLGGWK